MQKSFAQNILEQNALQLIHQNAAKLQLSANDEQNLRISDVYTDKLSGALLVYAQQTFQGVDVDKSIKVMSFKNGSLVSASGKLMTIPASLSASAMPAITAFEAVNASAAHLKIPSPNISMPLKALNNASMETEFGKMGIADNSIKAKLVWTKVLALGGTLKLAWAVEIEPSGSTDYWRVKVDAKTGEVIGKENYTVNDVYQKPSDNQNFIQKNNFIQDGYEIKSTSNAAPLSIGDATYNALPFPIEAPSFAGGTPAIQTDPWNLAPAGSPATTLKWNSNGTTDFDSTRGNNVLARVQHGTADGSISNEGFGAQTTTALPNLTFNSTANFTVAPNTDSTFERFSVTDLFYWNNIMHDMSYQYGFDEPSGNFQDNNQSRGGVGGDFVFAFSQFGNGKTNYINNSNFGTPPDGSNPVMHMFLFNYTTPDRDGAVDAGVMCHEYTHGISNRLTGGPSVTTCLENAEQMGEGWSDYDAIMITTDWSKAKITDGANPHPIGTYVIGEAPTGAGIRNYPYSTDMSIDPWTYALIGTTGGEVHNIGEIWTTVLWDMTWNIIQMDGINKDLFNADSAGGNTIAMKLVYEGLKLQPCSPGFIDGRDGILKADTLLFGGKYSCAIWAAFAKRGMGLNASEGSSDVIGDEVFDFSLGGLKISKTADKDSAAQNDVITYTLKASASSVCGTAIPQNATVVDTLASNLTYVSGGTYNAANRTVSFSGVSLKAGDVATYSFKAIVNNGSYFTPVTFFTDPVKTTISNLWTNVTSNKVKWSVLNIGVNTYYSNDTSATSDKQLTTANSYVAPGISTTFQFNNWIVSDAGYNGGVVEASTNNGTTWTDLGPFMSGQTYNGSILKSVSSALKGRQAFTGNGNYGTTYIDLSSFAGKSVSIRFRYCTSSYTGGEVTPNGGTGWIIDSISLYATPTAKNIAQVVNAGDTVTAVSGTVITGIQNATLPVVWGAFTATKNGNAALLNWNTFSEINTSRFVVQRSTDGINYYSLGTVAAAGNSAGSKYNFTDGAPLNGTDFYRLQQVDKNGNFAYSIVRSLSFDADNFIVIAPNPATDILNITVAGNKQLLKLYLVNEQGQTVQQYDMKTQNQQLALPKVSSGVYYLKIITPEGNISSHKVVIQ